MTENMIFGFCEICGNDYDIVSHRLIHRLDCGCQLFDCGTYVESLPCKSHEGKENKK
jgi:hypothetical protein